MYIRLSIAPKMATTKNRPHSMGSDHWFATYFDKGGNVNKYISMIERKYPDEKFDDDERRRFLVAHMSNDYALKLALYLRERGICIFNTNYEEDIRYMRAIFETAEQREERLRKEKQLEGNEDEDLCHAENKEEKVKEEEVEDLATKKNIEIKILLMKCGLKSSKSKNSELLQDKKEEIKVEEAKEEKTVIENKKIETKKVEEAKEEKTVIENKKIETKKVEVKEEKNGIDKKKNRSSHVYEGILLTNKLSDTNDSLHSHPSDNITKQIINDIILEKSKIPYKKIEPEDNKSKIVQYLGWKSPTNDFEQKRERDLKTIYKLNGIKESQVAQNGEMTVIARLSHLLDTGQFSDVNIRVGTGNNAAIFK
ncbi:unnamed protein product, partial [Meganyctiphanes norvegica]